MDIPTVIERYGIPFAILVGIAVIWKRDLWPFITTQIVTWQTDRKTERDAFISNLAALQQTASAAHLARAEQDRVIAEQIEVMAKAVQQVAVLVQHNYNALHIAAPRAPKRKPNPIQ